jgi:hypothetical protein
VSFGWLKYRGDRLQQRWLTHLVSLSLDGVFRPTLSVFSGVWLASRLIGYLLCAIRQP